MIIDRSKEQTLGDFKHKLHEADCHLQQPEPYSPWQQAVEGCIRQLKQGVSRKMIKTGSPKAQGPLGSLDTKDLVHAMYVSNKLWSFQ